MAAKLREVGVGARIGNERCVMRNPDELQREFGLQAPDETFSEDLRAASARVKAA